MVSHPGALVNPVWDRVEIPRMDSLRGREIGSPNDARAPPSREGEGGASSGRAYACGASCEGADGARSEAIRTPGACVPLLALLAP